MKLKMFDYIWGSLLLVFVLIVVFEPSRVVFEELTENYPYMMGFVKVSILATMGELLANRIAKGHYKGIYGLPYRFIVWGFLGCVFVVIFPIFYEGVYQVQQASLLPFISHDYFGGLLLTAFFTSAFMNLFFAPTFMALHRVTDTYIDLGQGKFKQIIKVKLDDCITHINWNRFISFVVLKTIPLFWIPMHTITFLLKEEYRILLAASLSIALGVLLSLASKRNK